MLKAPHIDTNSKHDEIIKWKNSELVKNTYANLFAEDENEVSNIKKIIDDCLGVDDVSIALQAWTIAVAEILLSSKYDTIKIVENTITPIYNKYLVST